MSWAVCVSFRQVIEAVRRPTGRWMVIVSYIWAKKMGPKTWGPEEKL